jgi:hypothetical protein
MYYKLNAKRLIKENPDIFIIYWRSVKQSYGGMNQYEKLFEKYFEECTEAEFHEWIITLINKYDVVVALYTCTTNAYTYYIHSKVTYNDGVISIYKYRDMYYKYEIIEQIYAISYALKNHTKIGTVILQIDNIHYAINGNITALLDEQKSDLLYFIWCSYKLPGFDRGLYSLIKRMIPDTESYIKMR